MRAESESATQRRPDDWLAPYRHHVFSDVHEGRPYTREARSPRSSSRAPGKTRARNHNPRAHTLACAWNAHRNAGARTLKHETCTHPSNLRKIVLAKCIKLPRDATLVASEHVRARLMRVKGVCVRQSALRTPVSTRMHAAVRYLGQRSLAPIRPLIRARLARHRPPLRSGSGVLLRFVPSLHFSYP